MKLTNLRILIGTKNLKNVYSEVYFLEQWMRQVKGENIGNIS